MDMKLIVVDPVTHQVTLKASMEVVVGIMKLVQVVVLSLLNVPGQDVLDPDRGGGLPELIGMNFGGDDSEIQAEVGLRVGKCQSEIIVDQIGKNLSPEERLREIRILGIVQEEEIDKVSVQLQIINEVGRVVNLVV